MFPSVKLQVLIEQGACQSFSLPVTKKRYPTFVYREKLNMTDCLLLELRDSCCLSSLENLKARRNSSTIEYFEPIIVELLSVEPKRVQAFADCVLIQDIEGRVMCVYTGTSNKVELEDSLSKLYFSSVVFSDVTSLTLYILRSQTIVQVPFPCTRILEENIVEECDNGKSYHLLEKYGIGRYIDQTNLLLSDTPLQVILEGHNPHLENKLTNKVYIHSILRINNSAPYWSSPHESILSDLKHGKKYGFQGVVVHVGSATKMTREEAVANFREKIVRYLVRASEECKLILETGCGEKNEILWKHEDLIEFANSFSVEERKKMGICVDTCHVFAGGVDPLQVLKDFREKCEVSVVLVHYNDSVHPRCSHVDRHAPCGQGYVGYKKMKEIAKYCMECGIDAVAEW